MKSTIIERNMEVIDRFLELELTEIGSPEHEFLVRACEYYAELLDEALTEEWQE